MSSSTCGRSWPLSGRLASRSSSLRTTGGGKATLTATGRTCRPFRRPPRRGICSPTGSWGGCFHPDFEPRPGEVVAQEHWLSSGFANTDLDLQLKKHALQEVIVTGMRANTCIESTVRFAAELGYDVTLVRDAIGSSRAAEMDASLQFNMPSYVNAIVTTDELVTELPA